MASKITSQDLKGFADAAQSLRLYRRAELRDEESSELLIDQLYVDPLQNDSVLETMLRPNTTFIVGRKGTGKSTIFQRAQFEIRKRKRALSAYIDIKTVFESSEVDPAVATKIAATDAGVSEIELRRVLLYRAFIKAVFFEIQKELRAQVTGSFIERIKEAIGSRRGEVIEALDELLEGTFESEHTDATAVSTNAIKAVSEEKESLKQGLNAQAKASASLRGGSVEAGFGATTDLGIENRASSENQYSQILVRTFNVNAIIEKLEGVLSTIGIKQLYIFIDDFSELPQDAMVVFVDSVLAPLNNWSNELIKFKVAGYPGRLYFGKIDQTKIDEIYLDLFRLYGSSDVTSMEDKAIDFTRRLIENRFSHFVDRDFASFCEGDSQDIYRHLFFATMGNARILGHVLHNLRELHLVYNKRIGVRAIQEASAKYYEEKIEPFFGVQKFAHETFDERSSIFSLKELLEAIVERARELKTYKASTITKEISGRTPSSHFHTISELDSLLSTLELNFFLTKFYEMKDRDGRKVSIYALNYGLCGKYSIAFGRPDGKREYRLYYVERIFDYTPILKRYLQSNQEIRCTSCGAIHGLDKLESIQLFGMMCPTCKAGTCQITNLSRKYATMLRQIDTEMLLPSTELGILETLYVENRALAASEIAEELDCSYQLVGRRGKIMEERGLVNRERNEKNRRTYDLTDLAKEEYFTGNEDRHLSIAADGDDDSTSNVCDVS